MKRVTAIATTVALTAALTVPLGSGVAQADHPSASEPAAGLKVGLTSLAEWISGLATHEQIGEPLPLTGLTPGSADALELESFFGAAGPFATAIASATSVEDLATAIQGLADSDGTGLDVAAVATPVPPVSPSAVHGIDVTLTLTKRVEDAPLALVNDAVDPAIDVQSAGAAAIPVEVSFVADVRARFDDDTDEFFLVHDDALGTPSFDVAGAIDGDVGDDATEPDPFDFPADTFGTLVGVTEATVDATSTLSLDVLYDVAVTDHDANGRLAFNELASDGVTMEHGELTLPLTENVVITPTVDGSGTVGLTPTGITLVVPDGVTFAPTISVADAGDTLTITGNADYNDTLGKFTNIDATELLGGVGQLANFLGIVANDPLADVDFPFLDIDLSQTLALDAALKEFVVAQTQDEDPDTVTQEFGLAEFDTVQELVAAFTDADGIGVSTPTFDVETGLLDLPLTLTKAEPASFTPIEIPQFDPDTLEPIAPLRVGRPELGGLLEDELGIRSLAGFVDANNDGVFDVVDGSFSLAPPTAVAKSWFDVTLDWGVDLNVSDECASGCDLEHTTELVETETLPVYQRFFLRDADTAEIVAHALIDTPADALRGLAGFVDIKALEDSLLQVVKADDTQPSVELDLTLPTDGIQRIQEFTYAFGQTGDGATPGGVDAASLLSATHNLAATGLLKLGLRGADDDPIPLLGSNVIDVPLTWPALPRKFDVAPDAVVPFVIPGLGEGTDAVLDALPSINFDPENPEALLATLLDNLESIADNLQGVLAKGDLPVDLPFLSGKVSDLFDHFQQLADAVEAIRTTSVPDPDGPEGATLPSPQRLRRLLEQLESQLGVDLPVSFASPDGDEALELVVDLAWNKTLARSIPIGLDALGGPDAFPLAGAITEGVESKGELTINGSATATLNVPIDLVATDGAPAPGTVMIDATSGLTLDADASIGQGGELTVNALGQTISLGDGGEVELGLGGAAGYNGAGGPLVSLDEYVTNFDTTFAPDTGFSCETDQAGASPVAGDLLCVNLPVYINGNPATTETDLTANPDAHMLQLAMDTIGGGFVSVHYPEGFVEKLGEELLSLGSFFEGLDKLAGLLEKALAGTTFGGAIPLFGEDLDAAADVVKDFREKVLPAVQELDAFTSGMSTGEVRTQLEDSIGQALVDSDLLLDGPDADTDDGELDDVVFVLRCDDGGGEVTCDESAGGHHVGQLKAVDVAFTIGRGDAAAPENCVGDATCSSDVAFDLGLPGLDVGGANVNAGFGWELQVGFGVDQQQGFYLLENPSQLLEAGGDATDAVPELQVGAFAGLPTGDIRLGLFEFGVADNLPDGNPSGVDLSATANLSGDDTSDHDEQILLHQLPSLVADPVGHFQPAFTGGADLDLALSAGTADTGLPKLRADFVFEWLFSSGTLLSDGVPTPTIEFTSVGIDLGSVLRDTLGGPAEEIRRITKVADPIREFLFAPIPVISDVSRMFGGGDLTFVDLAELFGVADLAFLEDVNDVLEFVDFVVTVGATGFFDFNELPFDEFDDPTDGLKVVIDGSRALQSKPTASQAQSLIDFENAADGAPISGIPSLIGATQQAAEDSSSADAAAADKVLASGDADFVVPFLEDPSCVFGMLAGGDCVVVEWTPDPLVLDFQYEQPFGPFFGILYITVGGHAGAGIEFGMGFSTRGARLALERGGDLSPELLGNVLLEGIFIHDFEGPELYVTAGINAGAKLDVLIAEAGARGGIDATLGFDLIDGPEIDGRVYLDEMSRRIFNPLCLFEVVGFLEAFLEVYVEIGACPFCVEKSFELARVRLLDFAAKLAECDATPVLASEHDPDNAPTSDKPFNNDGDEFVRLHIGAHAGARNVFEDVVDEQVVVRELRAPDPGSDVPGRFSVTAFGFTQEYEGYEIRFDAAGGKDILLFQGSKAASAEEPGAGESFGEQAAGADAEAPFTAPVIGDLGPDNDAITTGDGNDDIEGSGGNDQITLLGGVDEADGGPGNDVIDGGLGDDDPLLGDGGNDVVNGGPGGDRIDGGSGNDRLDGGRDLVDGSGALVEADGDDTIAGGFDEDVIFAGSGNDTVHGDVFADASSDPAFGGTADPATILCPFFCPPDNPSENDEIHGEAGEDTVYGGRGTDTILGDEPDDDNNPGTPAPSGSMVDTIWGQGGADVIDGVLGRDTVHGGPGADLIGGGDDADDLFGDGGADWVFGDVFGAVPDADVPAGVDLTIFQVVLGIPGNDFVDGGAGDDHLYGDDGIDRMKGNIGADEMFGGNGRDLIVGDDGTINGGPDDGFSELDAAVDPDASSTGDGEDTIFGGPGADEIHGEGQVDTIRGSAGNDVIFGNGENDKLFGDNDEDTAYGNTGDDVIEGGPHDDLLYGNQDNDKIFGQAGDDRMVGGSGGAIGGDDSPDADDKLYGGRGTDVGIGDNGDIPDLNTVQLAPAGADAGEFGNDELNGDDHNDTLHGQDGNDKLWGGDGRDQVFGELGDDELHGQGDEDYLAGDQATIVPLAHTVPATEPGGAPVWDVTLVAPDAGGLDTMFGGPADDHLFGGAATDTMEGNLGDDWMEGNGGSDTMYGLSATHDDGVTGEASDLAELLALSSGATDEDDLIGGSSDVNPAEDKLDEGELVMHGNAQQDVMTGDNANLTRVEDPPGTWAIDDVTGGRARTVELLDRERREPTDLEPVSGPDLMHGDGSNDRMFGQGDDDLLKGNAADDQILGNQGRDVLEGNDGDDDVIGGSDLLASTVVETASAGGGVVALSTTESLNADAGDPDGGDWLFGGAGEDVMTGDNAIITRGPGIPEGAEEGVDCDYLRDMVDVEERRCVELLDKTDPPAPENVGSDQLSGGAGVDVQFGQDARDYLSGGPHGDYQEGNGDSDLVWGDTPLSDLPAEGIDAPMVLPDDGGEVAIPPIDHTLAIDDGHLSGEPALNGGPGPDGQDDQIGGSSLEGFRDAGDFLFGDGAQDFQLGDNGELFRTIEGGAYTTYVDYNPDTIVREAWRYDVGPVGDGVSSGGDYLQGDAGDDYQWAQDGDDLLFGDDAAEPADVGNDDMHGELGGDRMFGGPGEDAMVGDRGVIDDTKISDPDAFATFDTQGPAFFLIEGLNVDQLDRRVDLLADGDPDLDEDGDDVEFPGLNHGGRDFMRGGPGHDSMHGAFGADWMNGDSDGDWLFGADGDDAMWGGRGEHDAIEPLDPVVDDDGSDPLYLTYVDFLFGGHGADVLDFRPRPAGDDSIPDDFEEEETIWREITDTDDADDSTSQHHQGVDWIYGGYDRDVLQGDVGQNGPEAFGDRLVDWVGAFNLYTRCNESYGDDGDIRQRDPGLEEFVHVWAYLAGIGESPDAIRDSGTAAFRELGFVFKSDTRNNNGSAHTGTPGNFFDTACIA